MNNNGLQIFQYLFDQIESPFLQYVGTLVNALISYAAAPLQAALVLYIALTGILIMRGHGSEPTNGLLGRIVKLCLVAWFATNGTAYATWVQDFFLNVLPNDIIQAVTAAGGNATISAGSFDVIWQQSWQAGLQVWKVLDYWDVGEECAILLFWFAAIVACVAAFAIWFTSHVILGLFIIIGPLVLGLVLFPATRSIFERWIGSMISCVILQVIVVIMVALVLNVEGLMVNKIALYHGTNQYDLLGILFGGIIFFAFSVLVTFQLPGFATALAGGLHFHTGAIARAMAASPRVAGRTTAMTGRGAWAVGRATTGFVRRRIGPSTGGSLSNSAAPPAP